MAAVALVVVDAAADNLFGGEAEFGVGFAALVAGSGEQQEGEHHSKGQRYAECLHVRGCLLNARHESAPRLPPDYNDTQPSRDANSHVDCQTGLRSAVAEGWRPCTGRSALAARLEQRGCRDHRMAA